MPSERACSVTGAGPLRLLSVSISAPALAAHVVVLPVGAHIDGGGEPVGHVVEARDLGDVEDVGVVEARLAERRAVGVAH